MRHNTLSGAIYALGVLALAGGILAEIHLNSVADPDRHIAGDRFTAYPAKKLGKTPADLPQPNHRPDAYSKLPVSFVENQGQTDKRVRYLAQGSHYTFFLTADGVVLSLTKSSAKTAPVGSSREAELPGRGQPFLVNASRTLAAESSRTGVVLGLQFLGANPQVVIGGAEPAPGKANYFRGGSATDWYSNVPTYSQVIYRNLWPEIDLYVRESGGNLKYEFHVKPGAQTDSIRLGYRGAKGISLDSSGGLLVNTSLGTLHDAAPVTYQEIDNARVPVQSRYVLQSSDAYSFAIEPGYRKDHELVIDPGVEYSTYLGGASNDVPTGVAVDSAGNAYVVGWTQSPDFPVTAGAFDRTGAAGNFPDVFVAKVNSSGTALVYSTFIGGSNLDFGRAIAIDVAGNAYIAGLTKSSNFPTTGNAFQRSLAHLNCPRCDVDNSDAFVTKLNPTGSALVYSTYLGGATSIDDALGIAVDAAGSAYVVGETSSTDFPTTAGAFRRSNRGGDDAYVTKLNPSGSGLVYSTFLGGSQEEFAARIAVDSSKNAYVLGQTSSPDFPTTPGAFDVTPNGGFDAFVVKLNATGSSPVYSTLLGGSDTESVGGLAIDAAGDVYISGATLSQNYPTTPGAFQTACSGSGSFVTKLDSLGSSLVYSTCLAGGFSTAIAVTPGGNAWITGAASSSSFPTTPDAYQHFPAAGSNDAFLTELNATGSGILYSTFLGGSQNETGNDLGLDLAGDVFVVGTTLSADFPTTPGAVDRVFGGQLDIFWGEGFVTKLDLAGTPPPLPPLPTLAQVFPSAIGVVGGNTVNVTVTLSSGAQGSGAVVSLTSSNPSVLTLPSPLTIPAGKQTGVVTATTSVVSVNTPVTITGSYNKSSSSGTLTILTIPPPATLAGLNLFPNVVTGGDVTQGLVSLTGAAPAGGFTVTLSSNNPIAHVPASVTVPQGQTSTPFFPIPVGSVTTTTGLTIFASAGGLTSLATLTVNPQAPPVTTGTLTVMATGRSGERVTSSPAGINVAVGGSMQAAFTSGTTISLSISNGRDAIWSGACSSGGTKAKSCAFPLNGNATVSANVQ